MHISKHNLIQSTFLCMLLLFPFIGYAQKNTSNANNRLVVTSLLLVKSQCDLALPGYGEKIAPYFQAWRKDNQEMVTSVETADGFKRKMDMVLKRFPRLSERAKTGVKKDCAAILTDLAAKYHQ